MQIKVCGLRRPADIVELSELGVNYLGLVMIPASPQFAGSEVLAKWLHSSRNNNVKPSLVGVFANAEIEEVLNAIHDYQLDFVQLQGEESADYCRELHSFRSISSMRSADLIKVFKVDANFDSQAVLEFAPWCQAVMFQTHGAGYGGPGGPFSWEILQHYQGPLPFLLGGSIIEEDADAIRMLKHPYFAGVDLNQGFEIAPGAKDVSKIGRFIHHLLD